MEQCNTSEIFGFDEGNSPSTYIEATPIYVSDNTTLVKAKRDGKWVILKGLSNDKRDFTFYKKLQQKEFDLQNSLNHPAIAKAFAIEEVPNYGSCIVMEWIDGVTLRQWLNTKPKRRQRRRVFNQLIDVLDYLHQQQVVHRDLKPENLMITRNGNNLKLIDFGLADADWYDDLKQPSGTQGYISPEQLTDKQTDCRNDIWSLGCIITDLKLGRMYNSIATRCTTQLKKRYNNITEVKRAIKRKQRTRYALLSLLLCAILCLSAWVSYQLRIENGRRHFQEQAQFRVANIKYTSWGGLAVSAQMDKIKERTIVLPAEVEDSGLTYKVAEIGFDAFRNDSLLQKIIIKVSADSYNILKGAFVGCSNLASIYISSPNVEVEIGNKIWPTPIDSVFDAHHFNTVTLYVPAHQLQSYRRSKWGKFKHIEAIKE